MLSNGMTLT